MNIMGGQNDGLAVRSRARARTEAMRSSPMVSLEPPPSFKQEQRERSSSFGTTFVSTAVVPAPASTEILSSLISSLTVLSDSTRDKLQQDQEPEPTIRDFSSDFLLHESFIPDDDSEPDIDQPHTFLLDPGDDEVAEAPVVGYARGPIKTPKKSVRERWAAHRATRNSSVTSLGGRGSNQTYRAPGAHAGIGVLSIERPPSSAAVSLSANASRPSLDQSIRGSIKMMFPSKPTDEMNGRQSRNMTNKDDDTRSTTTTRSKRSARRLKSMPRDVRTPDAPPLPSKDELSPLRERQPSTPTRSTGKSYNPLSPAHREDLGEHLIPERRSSSRNGLQTSGHRPHSSKTIEPAPDTKPPSPEEDIIEEEDPTLRRIKELQRAREKRQNARDNENSRPGASSKRLSPTKSKAANIEQPVMNGLGLMQTQTSNRGSPREEIPTMSATINGSDLGMLPAFNDKASPSLSPATPTTPLMNVPQGSPRTHSRNHAAPPSPMKHRRRFSGSLRRSSSLARNNSEARNIGDEVDTYLGAPRLSQKLRHPRTGRSITFSEVGDPNGFVVFVCAGMGITRYITVYYDEIAKAQKLRLITLDRPGTGGSESLPDAVNPAMAWADDVMAICQSMSIQNFSLLAHSAGAVYALATALKMPQYVKGRIHLLAPWIPPSQMAAAGATELRVANMPKSHKLLSILPTGLLKAANSRLLTAASAGMDGRSKGRRDKNLAAAYEAMLAEMTPEFSKPLPTPASTPGRASALSLHETTTTSQLVTPPLSPSKLSSQPARPSTAAARHRMVSPAPAEQLTPQARQALYNMTLTDRIWTLATTNANPAADLIVCFERRRTIGFSYMDVTRSIVIHHGRMDTRVPLAHIQWLAEVMPRCELRVLDQEDHSLMGSAGVMSNVLSEVSKEWEEWEIMNKDREKRRRAREEEMQLKLKQERDRFIKTGKY